MLGAMRGGAAVQETVHIQSITCVCVKNETGQERCGARILSASVQRSVHEACWQ